MDLVVVRLLFVALLVTFLGGAPRWIFAGVAPALGAVGAAFVWFEPYRRARVLSFLNPAADPLGKGHQALQSLIALRGIAQVRELLISLAATGPLAVSGVATRALIRGG